ncbi:zinc finger protein 664-like [Cololabis saira]|uniref:zinc finger protein 664-like n=1 Tax=Cololabis saira TaxID=129043 RepID=UPI002AD2CC52|nr:zinc finger protein 664-like [Cololabis saira]XP_061593470.1 zinc finger protein 664-like [Cololabis saira]
MSSSGSLREFISQRLTAAAEEIFTEFEKTIVQYEEEIDRQRRLLDITWKPEIKLHRTDLCKEEDIAAQLCSQDGDSSLDQEKPQPPPVKEEHEELCTNSVELLTLKQEADTFMVTPTRVESEHSQHKPKTHQIIAQNFLEAETQDQKRSKCDDPGAARHAELHHGNNVERFPPSESQRHADPAKKPVKCDFCGKTFQYRSKMKRHSRVHTGEKPYTCNTCGRSFSHTSALNVHSRIHTGEKPYSCKTCGVSFSHFRKLSIHMRSHADGKPYPCNLCGAGFPDISGLAQHTATHAGEKLHSCQTCGKGFRHSSTLTAHKRTHTGEKSYSCDTCGKRFTHKGNLTAHIRTHTGEKPYSCEMCGKCFTQRSVLTVHIRTHTGEKPYSCEMCCKRFRHRSTLNLHMSTHTGGKP